MEIRPVGAEFISDGRTNLPRLIDAFRNFANAPEQWQDFKEQDAWTEREIVFVFGRFRVQISARITDTLTQTFCDFLKFM